MSFNLILIKEIYFLINTEIFKIISAYYQLYQVLTI